VWPIGGAIDFYAASTSRRKTASGDVLLDRARSQLCPPGKVRQLGARDRTNTTWRCERRAERQGCASALRAREARLRSAAVIGDVAESWTTAGRFRDIAGFRDRFRDRARFRDNLAHGLARGLEPPHRSLWLISSTTTAP
jgi:hypothetical protein